MDASGAGDREVGECIMMDGPGAGGGGRPGGRAGGQISDCFTFWTSQGAKLATVSRFGRPRPPDWRLFRKDFIDNYVFW